MARAASRCIAQIRTNIPDIYAAGNCGETWHRVLNRYTYLPLGTTAHKQGRVAGENVVGDQRVFDGSVGTHVVKVFDLALARTGLRDKDTANGGDDLLTIEPGAWDHKAYYPGAHRLCLRVMHSKETGQLLGAQIVGRWQAEVPKRIDVYATALFFGMAVNGVNDLDLSYTPPFGSPWDSVQVAAQAWERAWSAKRLTAKKNAELPC